MDTTIIKNVPLTQYNTLRLESLASLMAFPHNEEGLYELVNRYEKSKKIIIIGKGANLLLSKTKYDEESLFVNLRLMNNIYNEDGFIQIESGATLSEMAWFAIENGIKNYEFLEDIPGTLGGAILMNAGTYKNYLGDLVESVRYYSFDKNEIIDRDSGKDDFSRRNSYWKEKQTIVIRCKIKAEKGDYIDSLNKVLEIKKQRFLKQPRNFPSAGSVFVRPEKDLKDLVVWELLDQVGLRGYAKNGAAFSDKHPGFIVNIGHAKYEDIIYLVELARERVFDKFDVELKLEWVVI
ncbi:UDP-N-acetylmuramate dehydrogenase [Acetobacterium paludosum]|uniref:UDP-N-acetylenolpyruvoylglucosamine reductase n=1 Tax=Acetobacterium paludosum TaxID=52693 RepID=A0A923I2M7_9FIRM|nr:UDP-N-acetylmuramate dehydrogenase [Acetobacterium paludosum]MBC3888868.1 UDP-N-acetylmuramate dehydrogenase [Acetobacterium paludosum]